MSRVRTKRDGGGCGHPTIVITAPVELDVRSSKPFVTRVLATPPGTDIVVDLKSNHFIGARGLAALVRGQHHATSGGARLRLANVPDHVRRLLQITELSATLPGDLDERDRC